LPPFFMDISYEDETRIEYDNFYIAYNSTHKYWYAHHYDEEKFDDDIIIPSNLNENINLFNEVNLTKDLFEHIKNLIIIN